jgi:MFS family permease
MLCCVSLLLLFSFKLDANRPSTFSFSCWMTDPINRFLGRRGCIFWSCVIAGVASIWEAFTYSWQQLFVARLLLGVGIGPKSATAPIYTAECSPAPIRGALVMQWQMWTAFGIALGDVVSVIFAHVQEDVAWRLMLGSTVIAPIFVCVMIYFAPESPRWVRV